jgi:hypothetical protein
LTSKFELLVFLRALLVVARPLGFPLLAIVFQSVAQRLQLIELSLVIAAELLAIGLHL